LTRRDFEALAAAKALLNIENRREAQWAATAQHKRAEAPA
jgi:hypothetical protein